ncbi:MAG: BREX-3 system P-loop-containing protein BrxF [Gammaproteobacteria bacterium]|nr:BREX-3 system P-loop-containing protein BrxF [Gammaproteobacteria bacterium]
MTATIRQVRDAIAAAGERYTRLVLLVGDHGAGKTALARRLAEETSTRTLNLGAELSLRLLDVSARQRPAAAADAAADLMRTASPDSVSIVDNIELLFLPELRLDPLKLLQDAARNRVLVATWPGAGDHVRLQFGRLTHPEGRSYDSPDALLVAV